jgi:Ca-activated chloride channel family protein
VDGASFSNARRFISNGQLPPKDAVRLEEFINYFSYDYPEPAGEHPFSIYTEYSNCPWNKQAKLLHIGIKGKSLHTENLPPSNLVFLLDVSGSMEAQDKLPLLKSSFKLLLENLNEQDRIAIVVYAGAAGLVLPSTSCDHKDKILSAIQQLSAGGSTAGGEGINLAYKIAKENFIENGNNRIILATDGDFNVGTSSDAELVRLIEEKRETGIFLSVLGFGTGNYKDSKMEKLANNGNGNYYYIDNLFEAKKVLVNEMGGTLNTIAKDVKIQIEFNPAKVYQYRLIGYENRLLNEEDFDDDTKDAGELGAGHSVTALYEIIENTGQGKNSTDDDYKYQQTTVKDNAKSSKELASIQFRYKKPEAEKSILISHSILDKAIPLNNSTDNYRFSAAVAEFGLLLRDSRFKASSNFDHVIEMAQSARGEDSEGYRAEFIKIVTTAKDLQ